MAGDRARRIHTVVRRIPSGRVATYGQIAHLAGLPGRARQVGAVLRDLDEGSDVPWQRVVNAQGEISLRAQMGVEEDVQRTLLMAEGVSFDARGRIDLDRWQWKARR